MTPPPAPKRRRNETRDLVMPIMAAVNDCPGVRVWRPHVLSMQHRAVSGAGLANGSADLVGLCALVDVCFPWSTRMGLGAGRVQDTGPLVKLGRFFALEVKWPKKKPESDQRLWAEVVRKLGGFCAVVHSEAEAMAAVERCRRGGSQ